MKPKLIEEMKKVLKDFYGEDSRNSTDYNGKIINKRHTERLVRWEIFLNEFFYKYKHCLD